MTCIKKAPIGARKAYRLIEWTNARVGAKCQHPPDVVVTNSFPRNVAGKTLERALRAQYRRLQPANPGD